MKSIRRRTREFVVQAIYQSLINPEYSITQVINNIEESDTYQKAISQKKPQVDIEMFKAIILGVYSQKATYLGLIDKLTDRNTQTDLVEKSILLSACYELNANEVPYQVIINEAIELAKSFGGKDSYKFINVILDKIIIQYNLK